MTLLVEVWSRAMAVPLLPRPVASMSVLSKVWCRTRPGMVTVLVGVGSTVRATAVLLVDPTLLEIRHR